MSGEEIRARAVDVLYELPVTAEHARAWALRGLHCGCGSDVRPGWLNVDRRWPFSDMPWERTPASLVRLGDGRLFLEHDLATALPVADSVFDWVQAEHLIEHLSLQEAVFWLSEMRRVVRVGGHIRISTPDLAKYIEGYLDPDGRFFREHRQRLSSVPFAQRTGLRIPARRAWMVNQIFYVWAHKWLYDFDEICYAALSAGFEADAIRRVEFRQGRAQEVFDCDRPRRNDESMYVELVKTRP